MDRVEYQQSSFGCIRTANRKAARCATSRFASSLTSVTLPPQRSYEVFSLEATSKLIPPCWELLGTASSAPCTRIRGNSRSSSLPCRPSHWLGRPREGYRSVQYLQYYVQRQLDEVACRAAANTCLSRLQLFGPRPALWHCEGSSWASPASVVLHLLCIDT